MRKGAAKYRRGAARSGHRLVIAGICSSRPVNCWGQGKFKVEGMSTEDLVSRPIRQLGQWDRRALYLPRHPLRPGARRPHGRPFNSGKTGVASRP